MTVRHDDCTVTWLGYATARVTVDGGPTVYTDPGRYGIFAGEWSDRYGGVPHPDPDGYDARDGDLVLVTHDHHYSSAGVRAVADEDATVVVYEGVDAANVDRDVEPVAALPYDVRRVAYGDTLTVEGVEVEVVPGYNEPEGPRAAPDGSVPHPVGFGCGFRIVVGETPVFWPGDSDALPHHEDVDASLFLPPIGRSYTMDRHEAAVLAEAIDPDLVLPIHYNTFEGLRADSRAFAADVASRGVPVVLDESDD
ncbi:MAG: MBL fold metallo-hydrolase [Halobacteriaceae archaeon]